MLRVLGRFHESFGSAGLRGRHLGFKGSVALFGFAKGLEVQFFLVFDLLLYFVAIGLAALVHILEVLMGMPDLDKVDGLIVEKCAFVDPAEPRMHENFLPLPEIPQPLLVVLL